MRFKLSLCLVFISSLAFAKDPKAYQTGEVLKMESVQCGTTEKSSESLAGEVLGTDASNKKTQQVLCPEYVLQSDRVIFRIRPRDAKHPALLPIGDRAQFRLEKDKMILRREDSNGKEREYTIVSMSPRTENNAADASPSRVNHLQ